jgi:soluble lytic murein transglycosylase-like protein
MRFCALLFTVLAVSTWPSQADAQIYAWRDADGTLVLSDRAIDAPTDVYTVTGAPKYVTTRPAENDIEYDRFETLIQEHSTRQALRPELVRAVIQVESGFNPRALSPKGAMGLMQLMPATARSLGVNNPWDPAQNIRGGTDYLRRLLDEYEGNEELALAAYNAGSGAVAKYGRRIPPYRETRDYVRKVGAAAGETGSSPRQKLIIYKTVEILEGRAIPRYSSERPSSGTFQIVSR